MCLVGFVGKDTFDVTDNTVKRTSVFVFDFLLTSPKDCKHCALFAFERLESYSDVCTILLLLVPSPAQVIISKSQQRTNTLCDMIKY